ncbi:transposase [Thermoanaerobacterium thermosaccharolyticum]
MIPASYVLFDTWFCSPSSLIAIKEMGYDIIAMAKKTSKMHYLYNGIMQPLTAIYKQNRKRRGRSRYLLSVEVSLEKDGKSIPARIVFVRNKNKRKDYLALITTDMNLNEDEIIRIYGKRWDIEVFFKVCKSYLKLGKGCNSLSYDAMTAHTAIVFTRYMMLALENRRSSDLRTMGEIFYYIQDEMSDITLIQAFHLLMQVFLDTISDKLSLTLEQLDQLLNAFMAAIPKELKERLPRCA